MNTITVQLQLCEEDRQRLDAILAALQNTGTPFPIPQQPTPEPEAAPEPEPIGEPEPEPEPVEHPDLPAYFRARIQKKVVDLSAAGKVDKVREIIKSYAPKVSALPDDRLSEVWEKLTALEV